MASARVSVCGAGAVSMPSRRAIEELEDKLFPWAVVGTVLLIIVADVGLIWVLF
jgi:hypothetical protein